MLRLHQLGVVIRSALPAASERPDHGRMDGLQEAKRAMLAAADAMEARMQQVAMHLATLGNEAKADFLRHLFGSSEPSAG